EHREAGEEMVKWPHVPNAWREPGAKESSKRYAEAVRRLDDLLFRGLLKALDMDQPLALWQPLSVASRIDRRFAALRCLEAIRLYAATHDGKLPAALKDAGDLPTPVDPITGLAFEYEVKDDTARLKAPPVAGEPEPAQYALTYELSVRR